MLLLTTTYGFSSWYFERFRMTQVTQMTFLLAVLCIVSLQSIYLWIVIDEYVATYVVFMTYNVIPLLHNSQLNLFVNHGLDFDMFMALPDGSDENMNIQATVCRKRVRKRMIYNYFASFLILLAFAITTFFVFDRYVGFAALVAAVFADLTLSLHDLTGLNTSPSYTAMLTILSRISIISFGTNDTFLGTCLNYFMYSALLMYHVRESWIPLLSREDAVKDSSIANLLTTLEQRDNRQSLEEQKAQRTGTSLAMPMSIGATLALPMQGVEYVGNKAMHLVEDAKAVFNTKKGPAYALAFTSILFFLYCVTAFIFDRLDRGQSDIFPDIALTADAHPTYLYGAFTLLLTWAGFLLAVAYRQFEINGVQANMTTLRNTLPYVLLFLIFATGGSYGIYIVTDSSYVFALGLVGPFVLIFALWTFAIFKHNHFVWNTYARQIRKQRQETMKAAIKGSHYHRRTTTGVTESDFKTGSSAGDAISTAGGGGGGGGGGVDDIIEEEERGDDRQKHPALALQPIYTANTSKFEMDNLSTVFKAFVMGKHSRNDYVIILTTILTYFSTVVMGTIVGTRENSSSQSVMVVSLSFLVILTFFFMDKYINTIRKGKLLMVGIVVSLGSLGGSLTGLGVNSLIVLALWCFYFTVFLYTMAIIQWKNRQWKVNRSVVIMLAIGSFFLLYFTTVVSIRSGSAEFAVSGIIGSFAGIVILFSAVQWSANGFFLSKKAKFVWFLFCAVLLITTFVVLIREGVYWFWCFSVIMSSVFIYTVVMAIEGLAPTSETVLFPSKYVLPFFRYRIGAVTGASTLKQSNRGIASAFISCLLLVIEGTMMAMLVEPAFTGWVIFAVGFLSFIWTTFHYYYSHPRLFWHAWKTLANNPSTIIKARQVAFESELGRSDAMEATMSGEKEEMKIEVIVEETEEERKRDAAGDHFDAKYDVGHGVEDDTEYSHLDGNGNAKGDNENEEEEEEEEEEDIGGVGGASREDREGTVDAMKYLQSIRLYWEWQHRNDIKYLMLKRQEMFNQRFKTKELRDRLDDFEAKNEHLRSDMSNIENLLDIDEKIRKSYHSQSRMMVHFMLKVINAAAELRKHREAVLKDFLSEATAGNQMPDMSAMTPGEVSGWIEANQDLVKDAMAAYVKRTADAEKQLRDEMKEVEAESRRRRELHEQTTREMIESMKKQEEGDENVVDRIWSRFGFTTGKDMLTVRSAAEQILEAHEKEVEFDDPWFPEEDMATVLDEEQGRLGSSKSGKYTWDRPAKFLAGESDAVCVFEGDPSTDDVKQGDLTDCYLVSAISVLATDPQRIKNLFVGKPTQDRIQRGVHSVLLHRDGIWSAVAVNDRLPIKHQPQYPEQDFVGAKSTTRAELWVSLVEKAVAKVSGGYSQIHGGGSVSDALFQLTGASTQSEKWTSSDGNSYDARINLWKRLYGELSCCWGDCPFCLLCFLSLSYLPMYHYILLYIYIYPSPSFLSLLLSLSHTFS